MPGSVNFAIIADLPLGAYRGRDPGGAADPLPAPARLHGALLCAAAQGPRAVGDGAVLAPSRADVAALDWLEHHPPDGVIVPRHRRVDAQVLAYRNLGLWGRGSSARAIAVVPKNAGRSVAVAGPVGWTWDQPPPQGVVDSLEALVHDVSHLGTSETPARLRVGTATPTHRRSPDADLFSGDGLDLDVAGPGRASALQAFYVAENGASPKVKLDATRTSEDEVRPAYVPFARMPARYVEADPDPAPPGPWDVALLAELSGPPLGAADQVGWAVAMHRALIAVIGFGAPAVLTGIYADGAPKPPNRVAVQFLTGATATGIGLDGDRTTVVVAIPRGVDAVDAASVATAFGNLRSLRRDKQSRQLRHLGGRTAARFWPAGEVDRRWRTAPVAVPDTRPLRRQPWSLADAVALSVALVFRDDWPRTVDRGDTRYRRLADAATEAGVVVHSASRMTDSRPGRWVHKGHEGTVIQPYRAELSLGTLGGPRAFMAIGQSRHLGGGLLVPVDVAGDLS
jgi:CRISPR-associated protein Csb2